MDIKGFFQRWGLLIGVGVAVFVLSYLVFGRKNAQSAKNQQGQPTVEYVPTTGDTFSNYNYDSNNGNTTTNNNGNEGIAPIRPPAPSPLPPAQRPPGSPPGVLPPAQQPPSPSGGSIPVAPGAQPPVAGRILPGGTLPGSLAPTPAQPPVIPPGIHPVPAQRPPVPSPVPAPPIHQPPTLPPAQRPPAGRPQPPIRPVPAQQPGFLVQVQPGETLSSIANQHHTTWQAIYNANKLVIDQSAASHGNPIPGGPWNNVFGGETLFVPTGLSRLFNIYQGGIAQRAG